MISKISVENIKGFGSPAIDLNIKLMPGKPNIIVAPNGFGKSSITRAFECLTSRGIELEDIDYYKGNKEALPSLKVTYEGIEYTTDNTKKEILEHFQCFVVNCPLKATSVTKRITGQYGNAYTQTKSLLDIEQVELLHTTPIKKTLSYSPTEYKKAFGKNNKLLPNINSDLCKITSFPKDDFDSLVGIKKSKCIQKVVDFINELSGTEQEINDHINNSIFDELEILAEYKNISEYVKSIFGCESSLKVFLIFWIINNLYNSNKRDFCQCVERNKFNSYLKNLNISLKNINTAWKGIIAKEDDRKLIIEFPKAGEISYGQRDSLYLFASLEKIKFKIDFSKPIIVIVDELFDYLDPVNMTIIQYFFSEFISYCKNKVEIYPIIFTHLSPEYFHNYTFSKMNVQYLGSTDGISNTATKRLLRARGNDVNSTFYQDVSKYLLHYHTDTINDEESFEKLGLRKKWGKGHGFAEYLIEECNKYFKDDEYDYYAITTAVRIRVEKLVFDKLQDDDKQKYLDTNGTKKKFALAREKGIDIPDVYELLGIIYNDAEHLPHNPDADKPIVYRLKNPIIKHMIGSLFNNGNPIDLSYLI